MKYLQDIPDADNSRAIIHYDMAGIFHYTYCKPGSGHYGPFYVKCFYYCNLHGLHYVLHKGRRYYCKHKLQYT